MKLFIALLFATLALNGVFSLPARNPSDDVEVIGGPRRVSTRNDDGDDDDDFTHFRGVIDTGSGYPFLQPNPSVIRVGFFDSFDDLFRRFRTHLIPSSLFGGKADGEDSDEDDGIGSLFPKIPTDKGNTTSTVKIVDGHKVEVNETTYGDANSVFKVRVVNIRPVEDGETVDETAITNKNDDGNNLKPVTSAPGLKNDGNDDDSDEKREPLEKKTDDNEIQGNIDDPEHSKAKNENIVETTTTTTASATSLETTETAAIDNNTMLPTNEDINGAFVTDNSLEQEDAAVAAEEELNANENNNGNGNNEFETNMSEDDNTSTNNNNNNDNVDNVENTEVEHTIENNEDTEEEINDNLNESSTTSATEDDENNRESEGENDDNEDIEDDVDVDADVDVNSNEKRASAALRHKERENEFSSDDEDASNTAAVEMHPTFNDEWGSLNNEQNNENNDLSNDIDVYDVEPIDLSNDIAVNDAADLPINPDAEFIDIYGVQHPPNSMPKFEKLSLNYPNQPASEEELEEWSHTATK